MNNYKEFIENKTHLSGQFGFEPTFIPDYLFDFQKHVVDWKLRKGRSAGFLDTGLGKTAIQLTLAENIIRKSNKHVLILTPLAVAFQFIIEAEKMGIGDIEYCKDGKFKTKIVITNYERLGYFDYSDFEAVILDESSILKNFDGAIKSHVTSFMKKVKYRFLSTATPSPNDFVELGTSSEALGYLGYMDMLTMFFGNNENNIRPQEIGVKWYLKPHAVDGFFKWVSSWSISMRKPSNLGFSDERFILPNLNVIYNPVKNEKNMTINGQIQLFNRVAKTMGEVREEQKLTIEPRCERAVEISSNHKTFVYWCNFNKESELLNELDPNAYEIKGSMNLDKKEELLVAFSKGEIKKLITKAKMTAFGLNWQHCNHAVFFPTWSYEQYYQAIRRFWRFGQKKEVTIDLVHSDGQKRVIDTLLLKTQKANELFEKLNIETHKYETKKETFKKEIMKPIWRN